jgi:NADH-quinone oxidoreductase subunit C
MAITSQQIINELESKFGTKVFDFEEPFGILTLTTNADHIIELLQYLYDQGEFEFKFLTDLCGVHYPDKKQLGVIYHVHSLKNNFRLRIKVFLPVDEPNIPSATVIYSSANWMERETYDFFGIIFQGHPNLRRILNVDDMVAFPMRKEHPLEDPNRIDKNDSFFGR